jgi:prolyl-tRNA synthetase
MRMTQFVFQTLREEQTEADLVSHQLMLRAGLVRQVAAGIFAYLPIGQRIKRRVEAIIKQEMDAIGGQEVTMPVVHPAELWQQSGRWDQIGGDLARFKDRNGRQRSSSRVIASFRVCCIRSRPNSVTNRVRAAV